MTQKENLIINKYHDIIAEELNVKEVTTMDNQIVIQKIYKPLGNKLWAKFGKDTGTIIALSKQWQATVLPNGQLRVFDDQKNERLLEPDQYDIEYQWLDQNSMAADVGIVVQYDMHITDELAAEGIAREISRFLNQMRKDAWFSVEKKAICQYNTENKKLWDIVSIWGEFLMQEALLDKITAHKNPEGSHTDTFSIDDWSIVFSLTSN